MPYANVGELPEAIREKFGPPGQRAFLAAFNSAYDGTCKDRDDRESCAFAVATAAAKNVKKSDVARFGKVLKADDEKQILFVPVLVPDVEDTQGDIPPADEIEIAAHDFAKEYTKGNAELGLDHSGVVLNREQAAIVETWIEKADVDYDGEIIPAGTWMIGIHIPDVEVWKSAKSGERTGASIEGTGFRFPE